MWPFYTLIFDSFVNPGSSHFFIFPSLTGSEQLWMFFSLCRPEWPGIRKDARTSASRVLTLKLCASALSFTSFSTVNYTFYSYTGTKACQQQKAVQPPSPAQSNTGFPRTSPSSPNTDNLPTAGCVLKSFQVWCELLWKVSQLTLHNIL